MVDTGKDLSNWINNYMLGGIYNKNQAVTKPNTLELVKDPNTGKGMFVPKNKIANATNKGDSDFNERMLQQWNKVNDKPNNYKNKGIIEPLKSNINPKTINKVKSVNKTTNPTVPSSITPNDTIMWNGQAFDKTTFDKAMKLQNGLDTANAVFGGLNTAMNVGMGISNAVLAWEQHNKAKEQFEIEKNAINRNLANQAKLINQRVDAASNLAGIYGASAGGSYDKTKAQYQEKYRVDGSAIA